MIELTYGNIEKRVRFADLDIGDTFMYDNDYFIKTDLIGANSQIKLDDWGWAVNLLTGKHISFHLAEVTIIDIDGVVKIRT